MDAETGQGDGCGCPGCGDPIPGTELACPRCRRRLPRELRRALVYGERVRHRDHVVYLDALCEARRWWVEHRDAHRR
jgi:predicted amidophosphoribosyltransferase